MIKAGARRDDGTRVMLLCLSGLDVQKLQAGELIAFNGNAFGFAGEVIVSWGATEQAIIDDIRASGIELPDEQRVEDT